MAILWPSVVPLCPGMKDLGVEASHVTLGILVKAERKRSERGAKVIFLSDYQTYKKTDP